MIQSPFIGTVESRQESLTKVIEHIPRGAADNEVINMTAHNDFLTVLFDAPHALLIPNRVKSLILQPFRHGEVPAACTLRHAVQRLLKQPYDIFLLGVTRRRGNKHSPPATVTG